MDLGERQIRSAGKGSGSIELTLPTDLRDLVGLPCRITLRDGPRPDIVLQPDLQRAQHAFADLWRTLAESVLHDAPPFPPAAFAYGLHPRPGPAQAPFLSWRDGLALAAPPPHPPAALSRTIAALAHAMAGAAGIAPDLAASFGAACGCLLAGVQACPDAQEACDLVALHLPRADPPLAAPALLAALTDLFTAWTADPSAHAKLRAAWRRGRAIELSGD